jgi:hypothetical protein
VRYLLHMWLIQMTGNVDDSPLVNDPNLLTKHNRVLGQATDACGDEYMGRQKRTTDFCRERRNDGMWTDGVSTVILQHFPFA